MMIEPVLAPPRSRFFSKNQGCYDFHKTIVDGQGVAALRNFISVDSSALGIISALVMTITIPFLLVEESEFSSRNPDIVNEIIHYVNTVCGAISVTASICCIMAGTFTNLHTMKVADEQLLECISHVKGRFWNEPVLWSWISFIAMCLALCCNVALLGGWPHAVICLGLFVPAILWMKLVGDGMMFVFIYSNFCAVVRD